MKALRSLAFVSMCTAFLFMNSANARADFFILPGMGCGCEDPFPCEAECGNACLQVCNYYGVTCHTWDYECNFDECWCGYEPPR